MRLTHLFTWKNSGGEHCPAVYATETGDLVVQGYALDPLDTAQLRNVAADEVGVRIPYDLAEQIADMVNEHRALT